MSGFKIATLALAEFDEKEFSTAKLPDELGHLLWREYGRSPRRIQVEFPSPKTSGRWVLKNLGYVGLLPLSRDRVLSLQPKVPIVNVFRMLEYAYRLDVFPRTRRRSWCADDARAIRELG